MRVHKHPPINKGNYTLKWCNCCQQYKKSGRFSPQNAYCKPCHSQNSVASQERRKLREYNEKMAENERDKISTITPSVYQNWRDKMKNYKQSQ